MDLGVQPERRAMAAQLAGSQLVPQIFVGRRRIGGVDVLKALDAAGNFAQAMQLQPEDGAPILPTRAEDCAWVHHHSAFKSESGPQVDPRSTPDCPSTTPTSIPWRPQHSRLASVCFKYGHRSQADRIAPSELLTCSSSGVRSWARGSSWTSRAPARAHKFGVVDEAGCILQEFAVSLPLLVVAQQARHLQLQPNM